MTVSQKPYKEKILPFSVLIIEEEEELFTEIDHLDKNTVENNHTLFQTSKQELTKIFWLKKKTFCIKTTIWKTKKRTRYALLDSYVKADQGFNLVIINPKLVKRLRLKIKPINSFVNHCLDNSIANGNSIELKSWIRF